ncbi:MAG: hypothetical protein RR348_05625 [Clostridia bacterium]
MAKEHNPKQKWWKKKMAIVRLSSFASGIRACYKYDDGVKKIIDDMEDGFEMCLGILPSQNTIVITKLQDKLTCKFVADYAISNGVYLYFKNLSSASQVLQGKQSFVEAYSQSRFCLFGETSRAVSLINLLNIVQNYISSPYKRKKFLKSNINFATRPSKVRAFVFFRGWL